MPNEVTIEQVTAQPTAVVRRKATISQLPTVIPAASEPIWRYLDEVGMARGAGRNTVLYHSMAEDGTMDIEVGVEVPEMLAGRDEILRSELPGGRVAVRTHYGAYSGITAAHEAVHAWAHTRDETLAGPSWEIYGHSSEDDGEDAIRTDIVYLLADKAAP